MIYKSIYLNKFFIIFLIIIILTGNFNMFFPYFLLLFIHELGHSLTGILLGYKLEKIMFYPLGGVTIFNLPVNIPLKKELLIIIMGPIFQIIGYMFLKNYFSFINIYHYTLLIFNLLPMYPLDGGRILNIICCRFFPYLVSFNITFIISIIIILILFVYNIYYFNLNMFLMLIMIFIQVNKIYNKRFFYYNKLLLERLLYNYSFNRIKSITNSNSFYRDCYHYVNFNSEKAFLIKYFKYK